MIEFKMDRKRGMLILLAIAVVFGLNAALPTVKAASGNVYYVATNGDDSNAGTIDRPWRTIQKAGDTMTAGDTCIVLAGNYDERVQVTISGTSAAPITYQADGAVKLEGFTVNADHIIIKRFEVTATVCDYIEGVGIFVEGSHCVIEDNYLYYNPRGGIVTNGSSSDCTIRNNRVHRNAMVGISVGGTDNLVEGNEIWASVEHHPETHCGYESYGDADGMRFFGSGHTIRNNSIHDISADDPLVDDAHIDCFQTWGSEAGHDIVFEQNYCENLNPGMYAFMLEDASSLLIRNNIIGAFGGINAGGGGNSDLTIVNNVFANDLSSPLDRYPVGIGLENVSNVIVKNNVFYDQPSDTVFSTGSTTGHEIDYNLACRSDGEASECVKVNWNCVYHSHDLWDVDPQFVDPANDDYHLQPGSPAIDAGTALSQVTDDFDGNSRPQGAGFDIGAYEYTGDQPTATPTPTSPPPTATPMPTNTPTPTSTPVPPTPTPTSTPTNTPTPVPTGTTTATPMPTNTSTNTPTPVPATATPTAEPLPGLSWEAEDGLISNPFVASDGYVSQSVWTEQDPASGGRASYQFSMANPGDYVIKAVVDAPNSGNNSFFVNVDGEPVDPTMIWDIELTDGFEERTVSWRGSGTYDANEFVPKVFTLSAGQHELIIRGREANTRLDQVSVEALPPGPLPSIIYLPLVCR